eukprot:352856-Chlamydomonas_euryale.AAC.7
MEDASLKAATAACLDSAPQHVCLVSGELPVAPAPQAQRPQPNGLVAASAHAATAMLRCRNSARHGSHGRMYGTGHPNVTPDKKLARSCCFNPPAASQAQALALPCFVDIAQASAQLRHRMAKVALLQWLPVRPPMLAPSCSVPAHKYACHIRLVQAQSH